DKDDPSASTQPVPDYLAGIAGGVEGLRLGIDRAMIAAGADEDMVRATEEAVTVLARAGAVPREGSFPSPDDVTRGAMLLCGLEAAAVHKATFPSRAAEYGPVLTGLLEIGRAVDREEIATIALAREAFRVQLAALFRDIDFLIMPATNRAAPTLED